MCGFTGSFSFKNIENQKIKEANRFCECRGPDNISNLKNEDFVNSNLWFNRLAIIDLSINANQPMKSKLSNSILLFNGEIYNSKNLKEKLLHDKYPFVTSHSDTEVLLAGLEIFGIDFINKLEGQFAFVYWKKDVNKIYMARDRVGQKPLYYSINNTTFNFSSNLKSVLKLTNKLEIREDSVSNYLIRGANFTPSTLFENIFKVERASYIIIDYSSGQFKENKIQYWNEERYINNLKFNEEEFIELFQDSVLKRLISDVPIATFCSGGLDSTSIIQAQYNNDITVNTFSVTFEDKKNNEKNYIDKVVEKFNTNHTEILFKNSEIFESVDKAIESLDEPYSDPSIVPTYVISQLISKNYKVAISGDGGDELLGGYERMKNHLKKRNSLTELIYSISKFYPPYLGTGTSFTSRSKNYEEAYFSYFEDKNFQNYVTGKTLEDLNFLNFDALGSIYKSILKSEYNYYLSDQMMYKVDRMSMANSLEVRSPFVDNKLIEYIFSHDTNYLSLDTQKLPILNYLKPNFGSSFLNRPKQGFVFDYKQWVSLNRDFIIDTIASSETKNYLNFKNLIRISRIPTRINSLRIWKVYVLSKYFHSLNNL